MKDPSILRHMIGVHSTQRVVIRFTLDGPLCESGSWRAGDRKRGFDQRRAIHARSQRGIERYRNAVVSSSYRPVTG